MSIKRFCDCCDTELTNQNSPQGPTNNTRLSAYNKKFPSIEVTVGRDNVWNVGDWCKYCIIDAVNQLDDRPKAAT